MPEKVIPGPMSSKCCSEEREAVCIHTKKIYDSCREQHRQISRRAPITGALLPY